MRTGAPQLEVEVEIHLGAKLQKEAALAVRAEKSTRYMGRCSERRQTATMASLSTREVEPNWEARSDRRRRGLRRARWGRAARFVGLCTCVHAGAGPVMHHAQPSWLLDVKVAPSWKKPDEGVTWTEEDRSMRTTLSCGGSDDERPGSMARKETEAGKT
jgi:hypothetical protein